MKEEIAAAVFFVTRLAKRHGGLDNEGRDRFAAALTSALFDSYKNHWYPETPSKGQAYRCLRMNRLQSRDPVLERACIKGAILYEDLGLPNELTVWVDPGEVSCRYGERCVPFCVIQLEDLPHGGGEFSRRIQNAVERAALDVQSGALSDEEGGDTSMSSSCSNLSTSCPAPGPTPNPEPKTIPTVSNPNSVYQLSEFGPSGPQPWAAYPKRKPYSGEGHLSHAPPGTPFSQHGSQFPPQKGHKPYRPSFGFTGPRVDKYHWVSKSRS